MELQYNRNITENSESVQEMNPLKRFSSCEIGKYLVQMKHLLILFLQNKTAISEFEKTRWFRVGKLHITPMSCLIYMA